ncbi:cilia- and flagella-associated protein 157-like [Trichoplusia ni]|uniref:Cilia- and flagella-associated protein 157 n=1 Tax=Trichoplusia ni TaxID=7111 RepID=A0A7E5WWG8_TRINI|nr:cilia- and flagella-associated protein 157-like [Trichoplusia ni]
MAPKKDKGKKDEDKAGTFNEVERTFLELQLAECNRKVARLRTALDEYELRNEELQASYDKLDEDRADIIAYLKKTLAVKNEENVELKEKVKGLEEIREIENERFKETTTELEKNFTIMKDQLTSENKLLAGKLNTLEEFRAIRDDLMKKFERQEEEFKDQEMKYKRIIYNSEKKFIIGKDKLKQEMEARLLQLAQDFQDATELRIAASTHRVIRENIAISNELDNILLTQSKVANQNKQFRDQMTRAIVSQELAEEERDKAISKSVIQVKIIDQLTAAFEEIKKEKCLYERRYFDFEKLEGKIRKLTKENENLALQVRVLEQNLHARLSDQNKAAVEACQMTKERDKLRKILKDAAFAIQAALKLDQWATEDAERDVMDRQVLLSHLLEIVSQYREVEQAESLGTIASFTKVYNEGDLGFVPKQQVAKKQVAPINALLSTATKDTPKGEVSPTGASLSRSSLGSVKTIPSIKVLPPTVQQAASPSIKDSLESFVATTPPSKSSEVVEEVEELDIEQQLAASKLEMQKSLMKDLAYSQITLKMSTTHVAMDKVKKKEVVATHADDQESKDEEMVTKQTAEAHSSDDDNSLDDDSHDDNSHDDDTNDDNTDEDTTSDTKPHVRLSGVEDGDSKDSATHVDESASDDGEKKKKSSK